MLFHPKYEDHLDRLQNQLRRAPAVTADLVSDLVAETCVRLPLLNRAGKAARVSQLIEATAWTDAALALLETELPQWKLRRLVYDDGQWFCSLSKQPNLPDGLDETADAGHEVLALAILSAFLEARRRTSAAPETNSPAVPQVRPLSGHAVCCDNFA
jgi:hypothetical protein